MHKHWQNVKAEDMDIPKSGVLTGLQDDLVFSTAQLLGVFQWVLVNEPINFKHKNSVPLTIAKHAQINE